MAIKRNEIKVHFEKAIILCIRAVYRSARYHPFVFSLVLLLLVLYRCFPCLFAFLVSSSPVIVCTTLLLGLLLSYGEPNIPEFKEEDKSIWEVSSTEISSPANRFYVTKDEKLSVENHIENGNCNEEIELKNLAKSISRVDIYQATEQYEGKKKFNDIVQTISPIEEEKEEGHCDDEVIQHEACRGQVISQNRDISLEDLGGLTEVDENYVSVSTADKQETADLKLQMAEPASDQHFESCTGLLQQSTDHYDCSDTESDRAESSSPDASMADIIPMLDELETLLNPEHASISKSDVDSEVSSSDQEMDDNSDDEEDEKDEEEKDGEEQEEKDDDTAAAAVKWTEDDQKNVMDLGSSELERNRRLESLIAKRRARKNLTFRMERNLIDLDADDSFLGMGELSRFRVQVPARRNPFDISYDSEETLDLPPIPGSAPSSLLPRRNPFDLFYEQQEQDTSLTGESWGQQDFVSAPHREMLFRRNETFSLARRELLQERSHSRLQPNFVAGKMDSEVGSSTFDKHFIDKSASKGSSIPESETISSPTDLEYRRELELHDAHWEVKTEHLTNDGIYVDNNIIIQENDQVVEDFGEREQATGKEMHLNLPISDSEKVEVIEQKHDERTSSSSNRDHEGIQTTFFQQSSNVDQTIELIGSVYDPSTLAAEKSLSNQSSLLEAFPDAGQGGNANFLLKFDLNEEISEVEPSLRTLDGAASVRTGDLVSINASKEELASVSNELFTSFQTPVFIDENKLITDIFPAVPIQDGHLTGLQLIELTESKDAQVPSMDVLSKSGDAINNASIAKHKVDSYKIFDSSDEESEEIHPSVLETDDNDESFPAEVVSDMDFLVELSSNHHESNSMFQNHGQSEDIASTSRSSFQHEYIFSEDRSTLNADVSVNQHSGDNFGESQEAHSEVSQTGVLESEIWSCFDSMSNFEQTVYNPKIHVLEASIVQEVGAGSNLLLEEAVTSIKSESYDAVQINMRRNVVDSDLLVVEARSVEDIHSAFEQVSRTGLDHPLYDQVGCQNSTTAEPTLESSGIDSPQVITSQIMEADSELLAVEARSVDDIHSVFGQITQTSIDKPLYDEVESQKSRTAELVLESSEIENSQIKMKPTISDSELLVVEARSIEDIHSAFEQISQTSLNKPLYDEVDSQKSTIAELVFVSNEIDTAQINMKQTTADSELLVVEARSVEDIHSAFEQISQTSLDKHLYAEVGSQNSTTAELVFESGEIETARINKDHNAADSGLIVVEARSVEDIHLAFEQISQTSLEKPLHDEAGSQNSPISVNLDSKQIQSDLHAIEDTDKAFSQLSDISSKEIPEMMGTEFLSLDEMSLPLEEPFAIETNSGVEDTFGEKPGAEIESHKEQENMNLRNLNFSSSSSDSNVSKKDEQD